MKVIFSVLLKCNKISNLGRREVGPYLHSRGPKSTGQGNEIGPSELIVSCNHTAIVYKR